jgi:hypothetical protein
MSGRIEEASHGSVLEVCTLTTLASRRIPSEAPSATTWSSFRILGLTLANLADG